MSANLTSHRPAEVWLSDLTRAKAEGASGSKTKTSLQDILERINDPNAPEQALIPNSPRSVEACFRLGIDPVELQFHPIEYYQRVGEDHEVAEIRYEKCENARQERIRSLIDERKFLIDNNWSTEKRRPHSSASHHPNKSEDAHASSMVEKERQRLEAMKRRQEKEMQQMVQHEVTRSELMAKQQAKIDELERRAQELLKQKAENEAAWITKQREIELQKVREEQEFEKEKRRIAEESHRKEKELQTRRDEEEKRRKKQAFLDDMERRRKTEEARKATEAILEAQAEEVRLKKLEMERRDKERLRRLEEERRATEESNREKRKKADEKIQSALLSNQQLLDKKRKDYENKVAAVEARKREQEEWKRKEEQRKIDEEKRKERERQEKYQAAVESEEMRKSSIRQRAEEKERALAELYLKRKKEHDIKKCEAEFELKMRLDKVDALQKTDLYERQQKLEKIMDDYELAREIMREKTDLQARRKAANMQASMQRQTVALVMDELKSTKDVSKLTGGGGGVSINELINRKQAGRPSTAR